MLFQPFFLLGGWICRGTGWSSGFTLFALRAVGVVVFASLFDRLLRRFELSSGARRLAMGFALFSSGFGAWGARPFAGPAAKPPIDTWFVDSNTLWSLAWNPLFPFSLSLLVLVVLLLNEGYGSREPRPFLWAGVTTSALALIHPYDAGVPCFIALAAALYGSAKLRSLGAFALGAAPGVVYPLWLSMRDPLLARHSSMGWMSTPGLLDVWWGFGLPGLLSLAGLWAIFRRGRAAESWPLLMWMLGSLDLAYFPVWFQRKLLGGLHLPVCLLAGIGADSILPAPASGLASWGLGFALVAFSGATHAVNYRSAMRQLSDPGLVQYYVPRELAALMDDLRAQKRPDEIVLASIPISELIPGWSGNTVVYGHWAQTVDQAERDAWVAKVLSPASGLSAAERRSALRAEGIAYVLVDGELRKSLGGELPAWLADASRQARAAGAFQLLKL